jgi:2-polyprenyl-3-methyl-5-hydroxy-6-metoxy-1,4-benzoquinol methylase
MRIKTRLEKNYQRFHELVPMRGKILDIGCGYGFMSYMLSFTSAQRNITGIDYDGDKIDTANNCFSKTDMINFVNSDVMGFEFEQYDAIILADMLHYLQPNEQKLVIEKCISNLNTGGMIIIRDGDSEKQHQHIKTKFTEFFSTKVLSFNKTNKSGLSFLSGSMIREIAAANNLSCKEIPDSKLTSNTIFILEKKV